MSERVKKSDHRKAGIIIVLIFAATAFAGLVAPPAARSVNAETHAVFPGSNVGAIPDNDCFGAGRSVTFNVAGLTGPATDVRVGFTASHTWVGDLDATLRAPDGTEFFLFTFTGGPQGGGTSPFGSSSNLGGTYIFYDTAPGNWWFAAGVGGPIPPQDQRPMGGLIVSGDYRTSDITGAQTLLSPPFAGVPNPNGAWTLRFNDCSPGDTGSVSAAALTISTSVSPTPTPTPVPTSQTEGDVVDAEGGPNGDGLVLSNDVAALRQFVVGTAAPLFPEQFQRADVNLVAGVPCGNGLLDAGDITVVRLMILGAVDNNFPACGPIARNAANPDIADDLSGTLSKKSSRVN